MKRHTPQRHARRARAAFTLLELIVVLGIISMLAGLLFPALHRARANAQRVQCLSNLRQCVVAALAYTEDHNGYFPPAQYREAGTLYAWDFIVRTSWDSGEKDVDVQPGLLWGGGGTAAIQQCPSFRGAANWHNDPYTGYNYNTSYIGHGDGEHITTPARIDQIRDPANCALFGDGQYDAGANKFMRAPCADVAGGGDGWGSSMRYAGTQGFRHLGRTNVGFADGHAASLEQPYRKGKPGMVSPDCGFISPDNSLYDLR